MIAALIEAIAYLVAEVLAYSFARLFFCLVVTVCAVFASLLLFADHPARSLIVGAVSLLGVGLGIIWEVRAAR